MNDAPSADLGGRPALVIDQIVPVVGGLYRVRTIDQCGMVRWIQIPEGLATLELVRVTGAALQALALLRPVVV